MFKIKDRWFVWCEEIGLSEDKAMEIRSECTFIAAEKFIHWALNCYLFNHQKEEATNKLLNEGILVSVKEPPGDKGYLLIETVVKGENKLFLRSDLKDINNPTKVYFKYPLKEKRNVND